MTKTVHLSEAKCGTGKTTALAKNILDLLAKSNVLILSPTTLLCDQTASRIKEVNPDSHISICCLHTNIALSGAPVSEVLKNRITLQNKSNNTAKDRGVVITTHQSFKQIPPEILTDWILIFDELPDFLNLNTWSFNKAECDLTVSKMFTVDDKKKLSLSTTKTYAEELTTQQGSAIGDNLKHLVSTVANGLSPVYCFSDLEGKGKTFSNAHFEENAKLSIENAKEVHILAANYANTLTSLTLEYWKLSTTKSYLTPELVSHTDTSRVTLLPLITDKYRRFSKALAHDKYDDGELVISELLLRIRGILDDNFIYVINNWATPFDTIPTNHRIKDALKIKYDCRGDNDYQKYHKVAFIASSNPNPIQKNNFAELERLTGIPSSRWEEAWNVTNTYEMAYQVAARTSIRLTDSTEPVYIVVPDMKYVEYLLQQFPDAEIDDSFEIDLPQRLDHRKVVKMDDKRRTSSEKKTLIIEELKNGLSHNKIATSLNTSKPTINRVLSDWSTTDDYSLWTQNKSTQTNLTV